MSTTSFAFEFLDQSASEQEYDEEEEEEQDYDESDEGQTQAFSNSAAAAPSGQRRLPTAAMTPDNVDSALLSNVGTPTETLSELINNVEAWYSSDLRAQASKFIKENASHLGCGSDVLTDRRSGDTMAVLIALLGSGLRAYVVDRIERDGNVVCGQPFSALDRGCSFSSMSRLKTNLRAALWKGDDEWQVAKIDQVLSGPSCFVFLCHMMTRYCESPPNLVRKLLRLDVYAFRKSLLEKYTGAGSCLTEKEVKQTVQAIFVCGSASLENPTLERRQAFSKLKKELSPVKDAVLTAFAWLEEMSRTKTAPLCLSIRRINGAFNGCREPKRASLYIEMFRSPLMLAVVKAVTSEDTQFVSVTGCDEIIVRTTDIDKVHQAVTDCVTKYVATIESFGIDMSNIAGKYGVSAVFVTDGSLPPTKAPSDWISFTVKPVNVIVNGIEGVPPRSYRNTVSPSPTKRTRESPDTEMPGSDGIDDGYYDENRHGDDGDDEDDGDDGNGDDGDGCLYDIIHGFKVPRDGWFAEDGPAFSEQNPVMMFTSAMRANLVSPEMESMYFDHFKDVVSDVCAKYANKHGFSPDEDPPWLKAKVPGWTKKELQDVVNDMMVSLFIEWTKFCLGVINDDGNWAPVQLLFPRFHRAEKVTARAMMSVYHRHVLHIHLIEKVCDATTRLPISIKTVISDFFWSELKEIGFFGGSHSDGAATGWVKPQLQTTDKINAFISYIVGHASGPGQLSLLETHEDVTSSIFIPSLHTFTYALRPYVDPDTNNVMHLTLMLNRDSEWTETPPLVVIVDDTTRDSCVLHKLDVPLTKMGALITLVMKLYDQLEHDDVGDYDAADGDEDGDGDHGSDGDGDRGSDEDDSFFDVTTRVNSQYVKPVLKFLCTHAKEFMSILGTQYTTEFLPDIEAWNPSVPEHRDMISCDMDLSLIFGYAIGVFGYLCGRYKTHSIVSIEGRGRSGKTWLTKFASSLYYNDLNIMTVAKMGDTVNGKDSKHEISNILGDDVLKDLYTEGTSNIHLLAASDRGNHFGAYIPDTFKANVSGNDEDVEFLVEPKGQKRDIVKIKVGNVVTTGNRPAQESLVLLKCGAIQPDDVAIHSVLGPTLTDDAARGRVVCFPPTMKSALNIKRNNVVQTGKSVADNAMERVSVQLLAIFMRTLLHKFPRVFDMRNNRINIKALNEWISLGVRSKTKRIMAHMNPQANVIMFNNRVSIGNGVERANILNILRLMPRTPNEDEIKWEDITQATNSSVDARAYVCGRCGAVLRGVRNKDVQTTVQEWMDLDSTFSPFLKAIQHCRGRRIHLPGREHDGMDDDVIASRHVFALRSCVSSFMLTKYDYDITREQVAEEE